MIIYLLIFAPVIIVIIGVPIGIGKAIYTIYQGKKKINVINYNNYVEPVETPFYINDQLEALDAILESHYRLLEVLNFQYEQEESPIKQAEIRKKQAALMLKLSKTEEQAYKLREKNGL